MAIYLRERRTLLAEIQGAIDTVNALDKPGEPEYIVFGLKILRGHLQRATEMLQAGVDAQVEIVDTVSWQDIEEVARDMGIDIEFDTGFFSINNLADRIGSMYHRDDTFQDTIREFLESKLSEEGRRLYERKKADDDNNRI